VYGCEDTVCICQSNALDIVLITMLSVNPDQDLSPKHMSFAALVADGCSYSEAYLQVYKCRPEVARAGGSQLAAKPAVRQTIDVLAKGHMAKTVMDKIEALEVLTGITRNDGEGANARIAAIRTAAELQSWNAPQQIQVMHLHELLSTSDETSDETNVRSSWAEEDAIEA
jgi:hypothetical protein